MIIPRNVQPLDKTNSPAKLYSVRYRLGYLVIVGNKVETCLEYARKSKFISLDFAIRPNKVQLYLAPDRGIDDNGNIIDSKIKVSNNLLNVSYIPIAEGQL